MLQLNSRPKHLSPQPASAAAITRLLPLFAILFLALTVTPLRAQDRTVLHRVSPIYPPIAKQMGITGTVVVTTTIDAAGKVVKAESTSGNKLLAASAIEAVKQWKFAAGDGAQTLPVSINFQKD